MKKQVYSYVRVSSIQQVQKTGIQRQVSKAKQWALDNGYTFNDTFIDQGVSAYKGNNVSSGELGSFIEAVKSGAIPKGSMLVIEALDRLSRQDIFNAMRQFLELTGLGLEIVTLSDNQIYSEESIGENGGQLMISLMLMMKANDESKLKSQRISDAKERAYHKGKEGKGLVSGHIPFWLEWDGEVFNENHFADVVKQIFECVIKGLSFQAIADLLNEKDVSLPPTGTKKQTAKIWTTARLQKLIRDKKVTGVLKSTTDRDNIDNYYPETISKNVFYEAQQVVDQRAKRKPSQNTMTNLFSGLLRCGYCGSGLSIKSYSKDKINERTKKRGAYRYQCTSRTNKGIKCDFKGIHSYAFEKMILETVPLLDFSKNKKADQRPRLNAELALLEQQQTNVLDNLMNVSGTAAKALNNRLEQISVKIEETEHSIQAEDQRNNIEAPKINYSSADIEDILEKNNTEKRQITNNNLQRIVKTISIQTQTFCTVELYNNKVYRMKWNATNDYTDLNVGIAELGTIKWLSLFAE